MSERQAYASDLSDAEWAILAGLLPARKREGRPREYEQREVVNAVRYLLRSGCSWRMLPHEFPPYRVVYHYFRTWRNDGTWERVHDHLRNEWRVRQGREVSPSAAALDSQSVKTTEKGG